MKEIRVINSDKLCFVDDDDYLKVFNFARNYNKDWKLNCKGYLSIKVGRLYRVKEYLIHHLILPLEFYGQGIDHINGNTFDNRKENLRYSTNAQNGANQKISNRNTSGVKGVYWNTGKSKWTASIGSNKTYCFIGHFTCLREAALAYNKKAKEKYGEFARPNDITLLKCNCLSCIKLYVQPTNPPSSEDTGLSK